MGVGMRNTRLFILSILALALSETKGIAGGSLALTDLDLAALQNREGPFSGAEQFRSADGLVLAAGDSLWVDLLGDAEELRATVESLPGVVGEPVICRFSTANAIRQARITSTSDPQKIVLPLKQEELLIVEVLPTTHAQSIRVHLTGSSLVSNSKRPASIRGAAPLEWNTGEWHVRIDGRSGGMVELSSPADEYRMEWIRQAAPWGTGWARIGSQTEEWFRPAEFTSTGPHSMAATYELSRMRVRVGRQLDANGRLEESYTFTNTGDTPLTFGEGGLGIRIPLVDSYPGAPECLTNRCHAHLWMGGTASYINALRMGGAAPHLGLVLTDGSLTSYSIHDRITHSNDRGQFVVHPAAMTLAPGESRRVGWVLFWHQGWSDFFAKAEAVPAFVRVEAAEYAVEAGQPLKVRVSASGGKLAAMKVSLNGTALPVKLSGEHGSVEVHPTRLGDQLIEFDAGDGPALLRAFVSPPAAELLAARVRFIVEHQQKHARGDPLDGALLIYDNETGQLVQDSKFADHNAGRERLGMGTLLALYRPLCTDPGLATAIDRSLEAYAAFVERELQNPSGMVFNAAGRRGPLRMYNFPWVAHFHLAMYQAYRKPEYLRRALETCRSYYAHGGARFYCIGMPVTRMLASLRSAGWENERREMLAAFAKHADTLARIGPNYPKHEVNYEQSIVGPAAQLMFEVFTATGDPKYRRAGEDQLKRLELFGGLQPDYHLHDIAIRHWDDFWFGKRHLYGDTFPHYWSTITATVFGLYAKVADRPEYAERAKGIFHGNFSEFTPEGRASCAYVYPLRVNGQPGRFADPWANDQDWTLVNYLEFVQQQGLSGK